MAASVMCGGLAMAGEPVVRVETGAARAGITAWDYVEASGDLAWPGRNIGKPSGSRRVVDEEYLRTRFEWSACHLFCGGSININRRYDDAAYIWPSYHYEPRVVHDAIRVCAV